MNTQQLNIQSYEVAEADSVIARSEVGLQKLLKELPDLPDDLELITVDYPFGAAIVDKNGLYLPVEEGGIVNLWNADGLTKLKKSFAYSEMPLTLINKYCSEVFQDAIKA